MSGARRRDAVRSGRSEDGGLAKKKGAKLVGKKIEIAQKQIVKELKRRLADAQQAADVQGQALSLVTREAISRRAQLREERVKCWLAEKRTKAVDAYHHMALDWWKAKVEALLRERMDELEAEPEADYLHEALMGNGSFTPEAIARLIAQHGREVTLYDFARHITGRGFRASVGLELPDPEVKFVPDKDRHGIDVAQSPSGVKLGAVAERLKVSPKGVSEGKKR